LVFIFPTRCLRIIHCEKRWYYLQFVSDLVAKLTASARCIRELISLIVQHHPLLCHPSFFHVTPFHVTPFHVTPFHVTPFFYVIPAQAH